jgi:hypothetical protein
VVDAVAADEANALVVLVRDDAPAVDLLLVDLAGAVEGVADERGVHGRVTGEPNQDASYCGCAGFDGMPDVFAARRSQHRLWSIVPLILVQSLPSMRRLHIWQTDAPSSLPPAIRCRLVSRSSAAAIRSMLVAIR